MSKFSRSLLSSLTLALSLSLAGCGGGGAADAPDLHTITGSVTLDGTPLATGNILFVPVDGKGRPDGGEIKDGKYTVKCTVGEKKVEITSTKEIPGKNPDDIPDYVSLIPERYNTTAAPLTVVKEGENTFDIPLTTK